MSISPNNEFLLKQLSAVRSDFEGNYTSVCQARSFVAVTRITYEAFLLHKFFYVPHFIYSHMAAVSLPTNWLSMPSF